MPWYDVMRGIKVLLHICSKPLFLQKKTLEKVVIHSEHLTTAPNTQGTGAGKGIVVVRSAHDLAITDGGCHYIITC